MDLTHIVYVILIAVAMLVIAYWVFYTRHLKTPRNVGKNEGIAMATHARERTGKTGTL
jgi:phosphotransferase system  glucose/maltose/N-acetylglucosamine-specific IIC component